MCFCLQMMWSVQFKLFRFSKHTYTHTHTFTYLHTLLHDDNVIASRHSFTLARDDLDRSLLSPWLATTWIDTFTWIEAFFHPGSRRPGSTPSSKLVHEYLNRCILSPTCVEAFFQVASVSVGSRPSFRRARDHLDRCCLSTWLGATWIEVLFQIGSR